MCQTTHRQNISKMLSYRKQNCCIFVQVLFRLCKVVSSMFLFPLFLFGFSNIQGAEINHIIDFSPPAFWFWRVCYCCNGTTKSNHQHNCSKNICKCLHNNILPLSKNNSSHPYYQGNQCGHNKMFHPFYPVNDLKPALCTDRFVRLDLCVNLCHWQLAHDANSGATSQQFRFDATVLSSPFPKKG